MTNVKKSGALTYPDPVRPSRRPVLGENFTFRYIKIFQLFYDKKSCNCDSELSINLHVTWQERKYLLYFSHCVQARVKITGILHVDNLFFSTYSKFSLFFFLTIVFVVFSSSFDTIKFSSFSSPPHRNLLLLLLL